MIYLNTFQLGLEVAFLTAPYVAMSSAYHWGDRSTPGRLKFTCTSSQFDVSLSLAGSGREKTMCSVQTGGIISATHSRIWLYSLVCMFR